jgi:RNA polymerase sigma factor (sigma-70 family)
MSSPGSVSRWIASLKDGNPAAAQPLWKRYYRHLVGLARKMLRSASRAAVDEEDVVQNVFHSFFRAVAQGRFPQLHDRNSLRRLLVVITANKTLKQLNHERRQKRGGGAGARPLEKRQAGPDDSEVALLQAVGAEPTPDFLAQLNEQYRRLLDLLGDMTLRRVAVWKMEGYRNDEIADMLACSRRTVARKLESIRILWRKGASS